MSIEDDVTVTLSVKRVMYVCGEIGHFELPCASVSKRVSMQHLSYQNEFDLHETEPVAQVCDCFCVTCNLFPRAHLSFGQRVLALTERHVGSGNEIALLVAWE